MIDHTAVNVSDYDAAKAFFVHAADGNNIEAVCQAPR
jgi:hypothetical protein